MNISKFFSWQLTFFEFLLLSFPLVASANEVHRFHHDQFDAPHTIAPELDPGGDLTESEISILKGDEQSLIIKENPSEHYNYCWKRVEIARAIGIRKNTRWIPELIIHIDDIYWPKSSLEYREIVNPCVWSLAQIGEPSVEQILEAIKAPKNLLSRELLNLALEGIRGKEGAARLLKERGIDPNQPLQLNTRPDKRVLPIQNDSQQSLSHANSVRTEGNKANKGINSTRLPAFVTVLAALIIVIAVFRLLKSNKSQV
jgi:hypothetical protein